MAQWELQGAREMERLLVELGPRIAGRVANQALRAGAKVVVDRAKELAPQPGQSAGYATGELRDSITVDTARSGSLKDGERTVRIGFLKPTSARAHLVEFGTVKMRARPFLTPALEEKAGAALGEMGEILKRGIEREAKRLAKPIR